MSCREEMSEMSSASGNSAKTRSVYKGLSNLSRYLGETLLYHECCRIGVDYWRMEWIEEALARRNEVKRLLNSRFRELWRRSMPSHWLAVSDPQIYAVVDAMLQLTVACLIAPSRSVVCLARGGFRTRECTRIPAEMSLDSRAVESRRRRW